MISEHRNIKELMHACHVSVCACVRVCVCVCVRVCAYVADVLKDIDPLVDEIYQLQNTTLQNMTLHQNFAILDPRFSVHHLRECVDYSYKWLVFRHSYRCKGPTQCLWFQRGISAIVCWGFIIV